MRTPVLGQTLLVKREPTNLMDSNAVAVYEEDSIVGHVPTLPAKIFIQRCNQSYRRESKQRSWIWTRDSMLVPSLWNKSVHRQDERIT